jgi:uncharacterized phage protein (TIGR01671 family)
MREIKFRAWDKSSEAMLMLSKAHEYKNSKVDWEIMQYIGLKDENSICVFIGDLIKDHNGRIYECKMSDEYLEVYFKEINKSPIDLTLYALTLKGSFKVIGNIYENPELLNP